jgi:hypothetical protein
VLGDFEGATLRHQGIEARMHRDAAGKFRMTFIGERGTSRSVEVVRTVGSRRYQQYLAAEGDSFWRLPVAYHVEERRWFPMTAAFLFADDSAPAGDPQRPTFGGPVFDRHVTRWNDNCVFCHNVGPNPGRDPASGTFRSTVAELGIACESCHGPGGEHVRRNRDPARRYALHLGDRPDPTIVNPARLGSARAADVCGRCHGQRIADEVAPFLTRGDPFVAGDDLALYSAPLWRDTPLGGDREVFADRFWEDGTPRLTAYEYQGFLQSACAIRGALTCTSCHGMHEGDPRGQLRARFTEGAAGSDRMCTGCHAPLAEPAALARHSGHDPAGAGGRCVGCHMPRIVYGVLDAHRSHRIEVPRPGVAAAANRPDACSLCHVEGVAGRRGGAAEAQALTAPAQAIYAGDPVGRAVAADALGRAPLLRVEDGPARVGLLLEAMASDRYPAVRHLAWRAFRRLVAPGAAPRRGMGADYDPSADAARRAEAVEGLRAALGPRATKVPPASIAALRGRARDRDLEIGE